MTAVQEAMNIIDSPESQDAFSSTFSFLQMSATIRRVHGHSTRQRVGEVLRQAAARTGSTQLAALASQARVDVFAKVKASIDKMMEHLKQQMKDETKQRDYCIQELNSNAEQTEDLQKHKADLVQQKDQLETAIETLQREISEAQAELHDTLVSMKRASEDRGSENMDFQRTVADQQATQKILGSAVDRLQEFYAKKALLQQKSLLKVGGKRQEPGAAVPDQPPAHKAYEKSGQSNQVIEMITNVIHDAALLEQDATNTEQKAEEAYETFMSDANKAADKLRREIAERNGLHAQRDQELRDTKEAISDTLQELERLMATAAELHKSCDFFIDNFSVREHAMADEIEALDEAKAVMSGMVF
jgi:chromosome segregation ATPase